MTLPLPFEEPKPQRARPGAYAGPGWLVPDQALASYPIPDWTGFVRIAESTLVFDGVDVGPAVYLAGAERSENGEPEFALGIARAVHGRKLDRLRREREAEARHREYWRREALRTTGQE